MESQCEQKILGLSAGGGCSEADLILEFEPGLEKSRSDSSLVDIDSAMLVRIERRPYIVSHGIERTPCYTVEFGTPYSLHSTCMSRTPYFIVFTVDFRCIWTSFGELNTS